MWTILFPNDYPGGIEIKYHTDMEGNINTIKKLVKELEVLKKRPSPSQTTT